VGSRFGPLDLALEKIKIDEGKRGRSWGNRASLSHRRLQRVSTRQRSEDEQPLVVPHEGQAWQLPARIICTPHWKQYGASDSLTTGGAARSGAPSGGDARGARSAAG
jgi:hypothetical protein